MRSAIASVATLLLVACSSLQMQVGSDPRADFGHYRTYAWDPAVHAEAEAFDPAIDTRIRERVEKDLSRKGLVPAKGAAPDLTISYSAISRDGRSYGSAPGPWYFTEPDDLYNVKDGALAIEFIDARTRRVVWQGAARDALGKSGSSQSHLARAVDDLMGQFPGTRPAA